MKSIYVVILFLVMFNVFAFMFSFVNIFPYAYAPDKESYPGLNESSTNFSTGSEEAWGEVSGADFGDVLSIFFADVSDAGGLLTTLAIFGVAVIAAWLTHSPAPFVVAFVGNIMKNVYVNNLAVFNQFQINGFLMFAALIGMIILFIVTCAEYLTHGDA